MRVLCVSDSHLENEILDAINKKYTDIDYYLHCGDSSLNIKDALLKKYLVVRGNHDTKDFPLEIVFTLGQYRCLLLHGNYHEVYKKDETLLHYMQQKKIDICFHGHTHIPRLLYKDNRYIINPGSIMINRASYGYGTYAIIVIKSGELDVTFYHHITHQECTKKVLQDGQETLQNIRALY